MKFTMNGRDWIIKEVEQRAFWEDDGQLDKMKEIKEGNNAQT